MALKKGDKVRFLNAVGGGIVSRVEGQLIFVEDEDGFEIPTRQSELVLIEVAAAQRIAAEQQQEELRSNEVPAVEEDYEYPYTEDASLDDHNPRFFLAFTQADKGRSGFLNLHAINDSNYFVLFTITQLAASGQCIMLHYGTIEPNTKLELDRYNPQRIDNQTWRVQLLLFKKHGEFSAFAPISTDVKIRGQKFFRDNAFENNDYLTERAVLISIVKNEMDLLVEQLTDKNLRQAQAEKEQPKLKPQPKRSTGEIIEVDLHINQILDNTAGLSNGEMLGVQLARFRHVMEENAGRKGQRIVFIHGVGNGTLKTELRKILDREYRKLYYQDASFREYGYGATMVTM